MKKLLAIVISMAMVLAMMPMGVFAETPGEPPSSESIHTENGIIAAHLTDNATESPVDYDTLNNDYSLTCNEGTITINVKGIPHKNGNGVEGKWIGIAVPIHSGATSLVWNVNDGSDINDDLSSTWPKDGVNYATLYWAYDKTDVQTVKYTFKNDDTEICSEELSVVVNATGDTDVAKIGNRYFATLQEAVNADGAAERTIVLCKDTTGSGIGVYYSEHQYNGKSYPAKTNDNFVIDLNDHTYTVDEPPVGSSGYETQAFHLEKGNTITIKNGTLKNIGSSQILIQNYCDLTLEDVTLYGEGLKGIKYVISNNFGKLTVKGNTNIIAESANNVAFDIWYGMSSTYADGINVTFDESFTGNVTGKIEYGAGEYGITVENWKAKAALNIGGNGNFNTTFANGSQNALVGANITITGGTFSTDPSAYLADNHIVWAEDGKYEVETFDAYRAGVVLAPLADTANNISKEDLKDGYRLDYEGENITINVKPQLHANGANPAVTGKWIGIAVPVPEGATKINWTVNGTSIGEDDCAGNKIDWTKDGVKFETLYWNYATKDIASIGYKFDNVGNTNTVNVAVNATPTAVIAAPLHDNAAENPIADNALYSKYEVAYADDTATITVKGLKAHTNGAGTVGKWVGIAVPADYSATDTNLIYKYGDGEVKEAALTGEIWTKDGKEYVCFYMDINSKKSETISYTFGSSKDNAKGFNTVKVNVVEESENTGGGGAVVPPTTDNVTNDTTDKKTTADLTPAVSDNKSTTTVDNATADKIVDKAVENKSTEVIVDAKGNNTVASSEVAIPEKTVKEISEKTDANLVIKTDNGQVDLDRTAVAAVAEQAGTAGTVTLVVETVKTDADICHVDLKLVTSNGAVKDFKGGNVKVTIDLDKELAAKELVCVYIDDNGIYTLVEGVLNADGTYTFTTGHFSEYAVMAKADAEKKIAEQLNTLIKEVNLKVRTSKTSKKNIKAVVSGDVKALTDAGYTVKYKFYRSTKKASKYTSAKVKDTNTYINTVGKKGTKYYYKAKALVYDGDKLVGQTELKQCKYGVRTWSK